MKEEKPVPQAPHTLTLENRTLLKASGVTKVDSFDEQTIAACTSQGQLVMRGENLHIEVPNVETGELTVTGKIVSMTYLGGEKRGGALARLFR